MYKKLGILGGMGAAATYTLYKNIIENTPVSCDQEHINMVILNASYIPDRTAGILGRGESPLVYLLNALKELEACGCDIIVMPCNTSHYYYDEMQANCNAKILNMPELAAEILADNGVKQAYLMATEGTIKTGVYKRYFDKKNIELIAPSGEEIAEMMRVIYNIKRGATPELGGLEKIAGKRGVPVVLGCTEFSAVRFDNIEYIDAMRVLLDKILELCGMSMENKE